MVPCEFPVLYDFKKKPFKDVMNMFLLLIFWIKVQFSSWFEHVCPLKCTIYNF